MADEKQTTAGAITMAADITPIDSSAVVNALELLDAPEGVVEELTASLTVETPPAVPVSSGSLAMGASAEVGSGSTDGATMEVLQATQAQTSAANSGVGMFSADGQELILSMLSGGSDLAKRTIAEVLLYAAEMAPNAIMDDEHGARKQVAFFRCLQNAINNGENDFQLMFATILRIITELKDTGAFQTRYVFRFFPDMNMNKEDRDAFAALLHVLITLSDPSGRSVALKQVDLSKAFQAGYTESGRQRLLGFFTV